MTLIVRSVNAFTIQQQILTFLCRQGFELILFYLILPLLVLN